MLSMQFLTYATAIISLINLIILVLVGIFGYKLYKIHIVDSNTLEELKKRVVENKIVLNDLTALVHKDKPKQSPPKQTEPEKPDPPKQPFNWEY